MSGVSSHCLVATHTFLEAVHYGVWLLSNPILGRRTNLWNVAKMPLRAGGRGRGLLGFMQIFLLCSAVGVVVLWVCFKVDYAY